MKKAVALTLLLCCTNNHVIFARDPQKPFYPCAKRKTDKRGPRDPLLRLRTGQTAAQRMVRRNGQLTPVRRRPRRPLQNLQAPGTPSRLFEERKTITREHLRVPRPPAHLSEKAMLPPPLARQDAIANLKPFIAPKGKKP